MTTTARISSRATHIDAGSQTSATLQINSAEPMPIDINHGLPVRASTLSDIDCAIDLQTLPYAKAVALMRECRRVLEPDGQVTVTTTDFRSLIDGYLPCSGTAVEPAFTDRVRWRSPSAAVLSRLDPAHAFAVDMEELGYLARIVGLEVESARQYSGSIQYVLKWPGQPLNARAKPLVSILIAAYRADYLDEALHSARAQTYEDIEILVGDDSPNGDVALIVRTHARQDSRIRFISYPDRVLGRGNYIGLFEASAGDFIKYLNDDDLLEPECVDRMARCLLALPEATLVTSHRMRISADGTHLDEVPATKRPVTDDALIEGASAIGRMLQSRINWIGEPTSVMFRRGDIGSDEPDLMSFAGLQSPANVDTTLWSRLLSQGDLVYLVDSLSSFRQHDGQRQNHEGFRRRALRAWSMLASDVERMGMGLPHGPHLIYRQLKTRPWWCAQAQAAVADADGFVDAGNLEAAIGAIEIAIEAEPADSVLRFYRAQLALRVGDSRTAIVELVRASAEAPHYTPAQHQLAQLLAT